MAAVDPQVIAFAIIAGILTITPGADTMLVIRNVLARGRRAGLLTAMGACCGVFMHATLSGLGLSLILVNSAAVFGMVKLIGAGYLCGWACSHFVRHGGPIRAERSTRVAQRSPREDGDPSRKGC